MLSGRTPAVPERIDEADFHAACSRHLGHNGSVDRARRAPESMEFVTR
jgi:hypothetical protein